MGGSLYVSHVCSVIVPLACPEDACVTAFSILIPVCHLLKELLQHVLAAHHSRCPPPCVQRPLQSSFECGQTIWIWSGTVPAKTHSTRTCCRHVAYMHVREILRSLLRPAQTLQLVICSEHQTQRYGVETGSEFPTSFPRVIILSATFLSSFARGTVVSIRSCRISCDTIVLRSDLPSCRSLYPRTECDWR